MAVNVAALLAALRADPAAKDAVRRELLTEELLALPVLVAQLATRLDQLTAQVQELVQVQAQTHATLQPLVGYVAALRGAVYERAVVRPRMVAGAIGAPTARVHRAPADALATRLEAAVTAGVLTDQQADAIEVANGVFVWDRDNGAGPIYCVVEASITPGWIDLDRAAARAGWLAKTGVETRAVVVSEGAPSPDLANALRARAVAWRRVMPPKGPLQL